MGVKQLSCQFYLQRNKLQSPLLLVVPSKSLLFAGLILRRFMIHIAMLRRPKKVTVSIPDHGVEPHAATDNTQQGCSSREIKRVFFAYFYFAIKKKYVGCRAETRRFSLLINELLSFHPETAFFRCSSVNLQAYLCGVTAYASAQALDFLATTKNCSFPI